LNKQNPDVQIKLGDYTLNVGSREAPHARRYTRHHRYGIFMAEGPNDFLMAGNNVQVSFTPNTPGPPIAGLAWQDRAGSRTANGFAPASWAVTIRCSDTTSRISSPWSIGQRGALSTASKAFRKSSFTVINSLRGGLARAIAAWKPSQSQAACRGACSREGHLRCRKTVAIPASDLPRRAGGRLHHHDVNFSLGSVNRRPPICRSTIQRATTSFDIVRAIAVAVLMIGMQLIALFGALHYAKPPRRRRSTRRTPLPKS